MAHQLNAAMRGIYPLACHPKCSVIHFPSHPVHRILGHAAAVTAAAAATATATATASITTVSILLVITTTRGAGLVICNVDSLFHFNLFPPMN